MWKNVYSFYMSRNTHQCKVLDKTTSSENIKKYCTTDKIKTHINLQNTKLAWSIKNKK